MHEQFFILRPAAWLGLSAALALTGCMSTPTMTPEMAVRQATDQIDNAQRQYVSDYDPQSLKKARSKLAQAETALDAKDMDALKVRDLAQEAGLYIKVGELKAELARNTANRKKVQRQIDAMKALAKETR